MKHPTITKSCVYTGAVFCFIGLALIPISIDMGASLFVIGALLSTVEL